MSEQKALIRPILQDRRAQVSGKDRPAYESAICRFLLSLPAFETATCLCGYVPVRGEIHPDPIREAALAAGKTYALPCTGRSVRGGDMVFRVVSPDGTSDFIRSAYGIPEPADTCPLLTFPDLDRALMIVPGLGFDRDGYRIGYGGGFYDRFLNRADENGVTLCTVSLAFSSCLVPALPHGRYDRPVDILITERGIYHAGNHQIVCASR